MDGAPKVMKRGGVRMWVKALVYPGADLNIRERGRVLLRHLAPQPGLRMLDAGCGNGYFSFLAYQQGLEVLGISRDEDEVVRCEMLRRFRGVAETRLRFRTMSLYELDKISDTFHRIVCLETLEHIADDENVLRMFYSRLERGGRLIIGVPNLDCPDYYGQRISIIEDGGHVRKGYSYAQLEGMLRRKGFAPVARDSYGRGWTRRAVVAQRRCVNAVSALFGGRGHPGVGLLTYLALGPLRLLDPLCGSEPMSVMVVARRP